MDILQPTRAPQAQLGFYWRVYNFCTACASPLPTLGTHLPHKSTMASFFSSCVSVLSFRRSRSSRALRSSALPNTGPVSARPPFGLYAGSYHQWHTNSHRRFQTARTSSRSATSTHRIAESRSANQSCTLLAVCRFSWRHCDSADVCSTRTDDTWSSCQLLSQASCRRCAYPRHCTSDQ